MAVVTVLGLVKLLNESKTERNGKTVHHNAHPLPRMAPDLI